MYMSISHSSIDVSLRISGRDACGPTSMLCFHSVIVSFSSSCLFSLRRVAVCESGSQAPDSGWLVVV